MNVYIAYFVFAVCGLGAFKIWKPALAAWVVFLGGWIVLPVGLYPEGAADTAFPYWIIGLALPSDMLLTKAWVAPAVAALGVLLFDRSALRRLRWHAADLALLGWCLWPALQALFVDEPRPAPALSALYLTGAWGLPWLLGRLYASTTEGRQQLARALAWSALACLPIGIVEGLVGPVFYGWLYGPHPFRFDGIVRYVGFRPVGFFEDGNQYGLWISLCALAAVWLAVSSSSGPSTRRTRIVAALVAGMAIAAQSVGAILLFGVGAVFLAGTRWIRPRLVALALALLLGLGGAVYLSGLVPIARLGTETALGRRVVDELRAAGRGSFAWRISQDQKLLPLAMARPATGSGAWDWWRSKNTRPWGLAMLLLGQFGGIGLALSFGALLWGPMRVALAAPRVSGWEPGGLALMLATLVVLAAIDALLNSFVFFPAIAVAGGLAALRAPTAGQPEVRGRFPSAG